MSFIAIIQLVIKIIGFIEELLAVVKKAAYDKGLTYLNEKAQAATEGTLDERSKAAKEYEDFINKHAAKSPAPPPPPLS